jgi:hypothetical protein
MHVSDALLVFDLQPRSTIWPAVGREPADGHGTMKRCGSELCDDLPLWGIKLHIDRGCVETIWITCLLYVVAPTK